MKRTLLTFLSCISIVVTLYSQTPFGPEQTINAATGANPYSIDSGDLNGDTFIDIVIGTDSGHTVEWYTNNGSGTFTKQTNLSTTLENIEGIHIADLDGMNGNDIIATGFGNDKIVWFANDGSGGFGSETLIATLDGVGQVLTADINNDNKLDIVAVGYNANKVVWYEGNGDGTFGGEQIIESGTLQPGAISIADFDGDNDLDIVIGYTGAGTIEVYYNDLIPGGSVDWDKETNTINSGNGFLFVVAFADVNDDGQLDIIKSDNSSNPFGEIVWYNQEIGDIVAARGAVTCAGPFYATNTAKCTTVIATNTVTVNGLVYTAVDGVKADNTQFSVDTDDAACAADLADSITNDTRTGTTGDQTATSSGDTVTIITDVFGAAGNAITLSQTGGTITIGEATFSGGVAFTVTVNGLVYTAVEGAKADNTEFSIDTSDTATAADLADSITNDVRAGITVPAVDQTATSNLGVVTITASTPGPIGNTIDLASNDATRFAISRAGISGGGNYSETVIINSVARPGVVIVTDLNNDTYSDIIISNGGTIGDDIVWFESTGAGTYFPEAMISDSQKQVFGVTIADFDGDGDKDMASVDYQDEDLNWFENNLPPLSINDNTIDKISIYPNPTADKLYIKSVLTENFKISVFDILGKKIMNAYLKTNNPLDVSQLHNGIYFIRFDNYNTTFKFIKK